MEYRIEYQYYQYNSGLADNGVYTKSVSFKDLEDAKIIANKINKAAEIHKQQMASSDCIPTPNWMDELEDIYIEYAGYFIKAKIFEIIEKEIDI